MPDERSPLLGAVQNRRLSKLVQQDEEAHSIVKSHVSVEEQAMAESTVGERLDYNDYTTIDWLHDLVSMVSLAGDDNHSINSVGALSGQRLIPSPYH